MGPGRDLSLRLYAAWTLARLGDLRGQPLLEDLLRHEDVQVRTQAVWTLGQLGDGVGIAPLRRALLDEARPVRLQAAWALAEQMRGASGEWNAERRAGG